MSEPPQPSWPGNQPEDPTAPIPSTPEDPTAPMTPASPPPPPASPPAYEPPQPPAAPGPPPAYQPPPPPPAYQPPSAPPPPPPGYGTPPASVPPSYGQGSNEPTQPWSQPAAEQPGWGQPAAEQPPAYGQPPVGGMPPGQPPIGGMPPYGQPAYGQPGYGPVPPKKGKTGKILLIIGGVILLLLCLCGVGIFFLAKKGVDEADKKIKEATVSMSPSVGADLVEGDCIVNDGSDANADLRKVDCGTAGAYQILKKIPFSTDKTQCDLPVIGAGKGNYDSTYTHTESSALNNYVLCLKKQ